LELHRRRALGWAPFFFFDHPPLHAFRQGRAAGTPINRLSPNDQRRITAVLTHLGWVPKRDTRERWWEHLMLAIVAFKSRSNRSVGSLEKCLTGDS